MGRRAFLEQMIRLAIADRPDVLCLQELPVWSLAQLERWTGMRAYPAWAKRPLVSAALAKWLTDLNNRFFRSAFTGQANAILLQDRLTVSAHRIVPISAPQHRVCQAVKLEDGTVLANLHGSGRNRFHVGDQELERTLALVDSMHGRVTVIAGDFNQRPHLPGFSPPGPAIDHILVRGASAGPLEVWPVERRTVDGRVLSDHAPVELDVDL
jgi:endonuclease/exonuclease/phosphatase family metal-dependent hydrolase